MPSRRHFLTSVACATAGLYAAGQGAAALSAQAQPARRQVSIGGRRVRVVDVHNHWDMPLPADIVKGTALTRDGAIVHPNFQPKPAA